MENNINTLFPESFESSRRRFRENLEVIKKYWPEASLEKQMTDVNEQLSIDWISAPSPQKEKLVFFTAGEHGIEAYTGSAMQQIFIEEYLPRLNPQTTGLLFVHSINPWGMKFKRRVNANNIDLNRTFVYDPAELDPKANPLYASYKKFLNPEGEIKRPPFGKLGFYLKLLGKILSGGQAKLTEAMLSGQYYFPQGLYYGGQTMQEETLLLQKLYRENFSQYQEVLHLDMHTGYGPSDQMSIVNSILEEGESTSFSKLFDYPLVVKTNPDEFYSMTGDMIDYVYTLMEKEFPGKHFYSTTFEFGTLGNSAADHIESMRRMIQENRLYWYGTNDPALENKIKEEFIELYFPTSTAWKEKAVQDARQAFEGILKTRGYIKNK